MEAADSAGAGEQTGHTRALQKPDRHSALPGVRVQPEYFHHGRRRLHRASNGRPLGALVRRARRRGFDPIRQQESGEGKDILRAPYKLRSAYGRAQHRQRFRLHTSLGRTQLDFRARESLSEAHVRRRKDYGQCTPVREILTRQRGDAARLEQVRYRSAWRKPLLAPFPHVSLQRIGSVHGCG